MDLPPLRPGAVYVFKTMGRYVEYADRHVGLSDSAVVEATEVSLVQLRPQLLIVDLDVPSLNVRDDFTIRTTFRAKVVSAAAVAAEGLTDLDVLLGSHLREHDTLGSLGHSFSTAALHELRRLADVEIKAYWMVAPREIAGMEIALIGVEVLAALPELPTPDYALESHFE